MRGRFAWGSSRYLTLFPLLVLACVVVLEGYSSELFFIGQRSPSACAEHDSVVVPVVLDLGYARDIPEGRTIVAAYTIRATHPSVEVHPCGASWDKWCCCDAGDCPNPCPPADTPCVTCPSALAVENRPAPQDTLTEVFDNTAEQVYVLDGPADVGAFEVIVNGVSYGAHPAVILGSRWDSEDSWPQDAVIYANGFTRWKPRGESPGTPTDPCFGTSVVLGPFHLGPPFLADGYSPNPLRHPSIDVIELSVADGWSAHLTGTLDENGSPVMDVEWTIKRVALDSTQLVVSVAIQATATTDLALPSTRGKYGLGLAELSSMFANAEKHDADTLIGPKASIPIGAISTSNMGIWGQEAATHSLQPGESVRLETTSATTHNTGAPTIWIEHEYGAVVQDTDPCWCAGKIAFTSNRDGNWEIYTMNDDLTGRTRLTQSPGDDLYPAWSLDCQQIAFVSNRDGAYRLYVMDADGSNQQAISGDLCSCGNRLVGASRPSWSPLGYAGGPWIAFAMQEDTDYCRYGIHRVHPDGSGLERITSDPWGHSSDIDACWSPVDSTIVYTTNRSGEYCLAKLDAEVGQGPGTSGFLCPGFGLHRRRYAQSAVSPSGGQLAYTNFRVSTIYLTDLKGSSPQMLAHGFNPAWSPDGTLLAYDDGCEILFTNVPTPATFSVSGSGTVACDDTFHASTFVVGSADVAEWVNLSGEAEPGDVLELDPNTVAAYRLSQAACSPLVAGVISTKPGVVLGQEGAFAQRALLALTGIVPVKATNEGGPIQPGDLLVTSSTPGHAMRWAGSDPCPCALVGKALEPMAKENGVILVLLVAH